MKENSKKRGVTQNTITFVVGPTAAGKSQWALDEAVKNNGIIINADSIQFYKHLNIGSAKPSKEEQSRVPHFLFDIINPDEVFTAGDFSRKAREIISTHIERNNIFIVGGSGFYFQALEKGMFEVPPIPDTVRDFVEGLSTNEDVFKELEARDPQNAARLNQNDSYRIRRALAVTMTTGQSMIDLEENFNRKVRRLGDEYLLKKVGFSCERSVLRNRLIRRTNLMIKNGLLQEVESLMGQGYSDTKALASVGYKECVDYLRHPTSLDFLKEKIVTSSMQLAKRQLTWFKRDPEIEWFQIGTGD